MYACSPHTLLKKQSSAGNLNGQRPKTTEQDEELESELQSIVKVAGGLDNIPRRNEAMSTTSPQIPKELSQVDDFASYSREFLLDENPISKIKSYAERIDDMEFLKMETRLSIFENCTFSNCNFENASFIDVIFQSCDFSNSKFREAYFERCCFHCCKCVGMDMNNTIVKQTAFEQSNLQYSNFNETKMTDVLFDHTDFAEASMAKAKLKRFEAKGSSFVKNNFFKTTLESVDFRDNEFSMPMVSSPPVELKGAIINMLQAADLMGLWGVIVNG